MGWDGIQWMGMFLVVLVVLCVFFLFRVALAPVGGDEYEGVRKDLE